MATVRKERLRRSDRLHQRITVGRHLTTALIGGGLGLAAALALSEFLGWV
ncbi:MAG: hypothetical protein HQL57_01430 [Magnetococcales bacterium]|nr:hypothetical protein [Magnetococcales bacterium]MBF0155832.1 hypothetical protein [Magnetococcales bacterium]